MGFDLIDEGSHLLFYNYPNEYPITFHNYQYFVSLLPNRILTISNLRVMGWLVELVGTIALIIGIWVYFKPHLKQQRNLFVIFALFCLSSLGLSVHDRMLGYNIINMSLTYISFGACLIILGKSSSVKRDFLVFSLIGSLMSVVLFIKMTTFFLLIPIFILLIIVHRQRNLLSFIAALFVGVLAGIVVSWGIVSMSNPNWVSDFKLGFKLGRISGYGSLYLTVSKFLFPVFTILLKLAFSILVPIGILKIFRVKILNQISKLNLFLLYLVSVFFLLTIIYITSYTDYYIELHKMESNLLYVAPIFILHFLFFLLAINSFVFVVKWKFNSNKKIVWVIVGLICIAPANFFGSFSSNLESLYAYSLPILAIIFIFSVVFEQAKSSLPINRFAILILSTFCFVLFIQVKWILPSRLLVSMKHQTEKIDISENISLDQPTADYILDLKTALERLPNTKYVSYIGNYAGTVYLLDKIQIGTTLYLSLPYPGEMDEMNASFNRFFYKEYNEKFKNSMLLISSGIYPTNLYTELETGILDGQNHVKVDSVFNPFLEKEMIINNRIQYPYTYIYLPKNAHNN